MSGTFKREREVRGESHEYEFVGKRVLQRKEEREGGKPEQKGTIPKDFTPR